MYLGARNTTGLSREEAAERIHIGTKTLANYESGATTPPPDVVDRMAEVYGIHALTMLYCKKECEIGRKYCFDLLNNVDLSPMAILAKYSQEEREAHMAFEHLLQLLINKKARVDCSKEELAEIKMWTGHLLDLEHVIETMKMALWNFLDVGDLVMTHNKKCLDKHYVDYKKPELVMTG